MPHERGFCVSTASPLGQSTHYRYNSSGDPIQRIDAHGKALHYKYDAAGRLIALVNENAATYQFRYDVVDNLTDEIGFDGRHQRYCYNVVGELTHVIETGGSALGPGKVTHLERDVLGRLVAKRCEGEISNNDSDTTDTTDTTSTTFTYDPLGRLTAAINPAAHLRFAYDAIGQIISETQEMGSGSSSSKSQFTRQLSHSYDALGNRLQTLLPDGRSLNWLFYGSGHLHQINLDGEVLADIERDALHRETSRSQGQLKSQFDYDPAGRLVRHRASAQRAVNAVLERAYAYDATGQLVARADSLRGRQDFKYDPVGRILSALPSAFAGAASTHQSELFAFDPAGNLLPENSNKNNSTSGNEYAGYSQNSIIPDNRLKVYQDLAFAYDAHGNVTQRMRGNQAAGTHSDATFSWNADHQLAQATVSRHGVTQTTRYAYDALGRRVSKLDSFGATHYLWDGDLMVHSQRGSKDALFVFEPNSFVPLATVQGTKNDKQTYWYQCDQIGAPQELTDAQGHIVWAADYKVWGEAKVRQITLPQSYRTGTDDYSANDFTPKRGGTWKLAGSNSANSNSKAVAANQFIQIEQPFRFQGQQFDEETGLHYNRFRYYDPVIGRFVSQDPIGLAGGFNTFAYAPNSLDWIDPLGLLKASYKHNPNGTLKSATAKITPNDLGTGSSTNASSRKKAKGFGCAGDDAGHGIGEQLGGNGGVNGTFPQSPNVNRGAFRDYENAVKADVAAGKNVIVRVVPQYKVGATRPHEVLYQKRVDGRTTSQTFQNPCCC